MKRRTFITGTTATLAVVAGCLDDGEEDEAESDVESSGPDGPPFPVTTVDAPGSEAGTVNVPADGQVQLVNFIRTTCPTSRGMLTYVGEARDRLADRYAVGPDGRVHVLTIVNGNAGAQLSPEELSDWWAEQDGDWTIGIDESGALFDYHDVTGTPTMIAIDGTGEVHWRDKGGTTTERLVSGVERALEAGETSESDTDSATGESGSETGNRTDSSGNETDSQ